MNKKQRIKACIHHENVDRTPWQINYTSELAKRLMKELGLEYRFSNVLGENILKYGALDDYFDNHIAYIRNRSVRSYSEVSPGVFRDEWGVMWDRTIDKDIGTPVNVVLTNPTTEGLKIPDPDANERYSHAPLIIQTNADRYIVSKFSYSLFERAWSLRGMQNLMTDFLENPSFVDELFDSITEFNLRVMKNLRQFSIDAIQFGDDWGGQNGLLIDPSSWRTFLKPRLKLMYDQAHAQGYDVFIHSCGDISCILDDLVEIGVNVYNPFQPEVVDRNQLMVHYSGKLVFYGGISLQHTLPFGSTSDVQHEVSNLFSLANRYGGLIISPSHDMTPDVPLNNIQAMLDVILNG
jgi:uroporphyrinogen decarboxylase